VNVAVCHYGAGNVRSVVLALERLGVRPPIRVNVTADPDEVARADLAVLPGVGSAPSAMAHLERRGVAQALSERNGLTLGICLGLHLALDRSDEDGGVDGLGLVPGRAVRIDAERVPRIGWARVEPGGGTYWFAHSYAAETPAAVAHSEGIPAIVERGVFVGVQFHPEKSGREGERWLERCLSRV
jgi:imidazole glycerol-phosphate synthase subunit HisH